MISIYCDHAQPQFIVILIMVIIRSLLTHETNGSGELKPSPAGHLKTLICSIRRKSEQFIDFLQKPGKNGPVHFY